jgi:hypothetical protein
VTLKAGGTQKANHAHTRRLHERRAGRDGKHDLREPELAAAYHSLQLHWLKTVPGYRALVQAKVEEAQRAHKGPIGFCVECKGDLARNRFTSGCYACADRKAKQASRQRRRDVDHLGKEVEGCG